MNKQILSFVAKVNIFDVSQTNACCPLFCIVLSAMYEGLSDGSLKDAPSQGSQHFWTKKIFSLMLRKGRLNGERQGNYKNFKTQHDS
jgi:hypothetical protein